MPILKSYEGTKVGTCTVVEEQGAKDRRRTTHHCRCTRSNLRFPAAVRKNTIQQALKKDREICPFCPRKPRKLRRITIGQSVCGALLVARAANGIYPGGRQHVRLTIECPCKNQWTINGEEWLRAISGQRQSKFICGRFCANAEWPEPHGYWEVEGPADPPPGKENSEEFWWNVRCTAPIEGGNECSRMRVKPTSGLKSRRTSKHCGCQTPKQVADRHAETRNQLAIGVRKILKDYIDPENEWHFQLDLERSTALLTSTCLYCARAPHQTTKVEIYPGKGRKIELPSFVHGGIDRVDPAGRYLVSNSVPACKTCNWFKGGQQLSDFVQRLHRVMSRAPAITAVIGGPLVLPPASAFLRLNQASFCEPVYAYILKSLYRAKRDAAVKEGWEFKLQFVGFELLSHSDCLYCGCSPSARAQFHVQHGPKDRCGECPPVFLYHGIDRLDNRLGYVPGNMAPCCPACNRAKKNHTVEAFLRHTELLQSQIPFWSSRIESWTGSFVPIAY